MSDNSNTDLYVMDDNVNIYDYKFLLTLNQEKRHDHVNNLSSFTINNWFAVLFLLQGPYSQSYYDYDTGHNKLRVFKKRKLTNI